jgi:hypothetical protein
MKLDLYICIIIILSLHAYIYIYIQIEEVRLYKQIYNFTFHIGFGILRLMHQITFKLTRLSS